MLGKIMSGLGQLTLSDFTSIGFCLEGLFYGIYSGIFAMYFQYYYSKRAADYQTTNITFYSLCILYVLTIIQFASDLKSSFLPVQAATLNHNFYVIKVALSGCCDFIAQSILIYRCWIVWNRNVCVVVIPSVLAFIFLGLWVAPCSALVYNASVGDILSANWAYALIETSLGMSLAVNALVTSLIVLKILKVYSEVRPSYSQTYGPSGGSKLRPVTFVIIESGMVLFSIQLTRLVLSIVQTNTASDAYQIIVFVHEMFNGITPTIIQVRVSMGLSFYDQPSLEEITSSLRFGSDQGRRNSISGTGSHSIVDEENGDDGIDIQRLGSNDIESRDENIVAVQPSSDIIEVQRDDH